MGISRRSGTWPTWKCGNPSNRKTLKKTGSLTFWSSLTWKKSKRKPNDAVSTRPWKCGAKIWQSPTVQMGTSGLYHRKMVEFWPEKKLGFASKYWQIGDFLAVRMRMWPETRTSCYLANKYGQSCSVLNCWIPLTMLKPERSKVYAGYTSRRRTIGWKITQHVPVLLSRIAIGNEIKNHYWNWKSISWYNTYHNIYILWLL